MWYQRIQNFVCIFRKELPATSNRQPNYHKRICYRNTRRLTYLFSSYQLERGAKRYELANHLGNVLTVISDKKTAICTGNTFNYFTAERISATDYSPFGAPLAGRSWNGGEYRFSFNGKEYDNEVKGNGNQQDYGMRIYDTRLGRFLSVDPLAKSFAFYTPFQYAGNKPIVAIDMDGKEDVWFHFIEQIDGSLLQVSSELDVNEATRNDLQKNLGHEIPIDGTLYTVTLNDNTVCVLEYMPSVIISEEKVFELDMFVWNNFGGDTYGELSGSDNPGNDRVLPGGPEAGGVTTLGYDCIVGGGAGVSYSILETPSEKSAHYVTFKQAIGYSKGFSSGISFGFYTGDDSKDLKEQSAGIEGNGAVVNFFILSLSGDLSKDSETGKTSFGTNWIFIGINANLGVDVGVTQTKKIE